MFGIVQGLFYLACFLLQVRPFGCRFPNQPLVHKHFKMVEANSASGREMSGVCRGVGGEETVT